MRPGQELLAEKTGEMKAEMQAAGATGLRIADYVKAGDSITLTLDTAGKGMKGLSVDSWLDSPDKKVTLGVQMQSLPDGASYAGSITLAVPSDHIEVRITNSNYQKPAQ